MTIVARGRWISDPAPVARNKGIKPNAVVKAVMSTGLRSEFVGANATDVRRIDDGAGVVRTFNVPSSGSGTNSVPS